jgi:hypothetical protein
MRGASGETCELSKLDSCGAWRVLFDSDPIKLTDFRICLWIKAEEIVESVGKYKLQEITQ